MVVVCLGAIAWHAALRQWSPDTRPRPPFTHLAEQGAGAVTLLASYHPSRQNTNTGRLTPEQFDAVFTRAREKLEYM
jgi:uracil-DNA glycosylase